MGPKMEPQTYQKRGSKTEPDIISLSFGLSGLSGAEVLPFGPKRRRNRRRRRSVKYVQKRMGGDIYTRNIALASLAHVSSALRAGLFLDYDAGHSEL